MRDSLPSRKTTIRALGTYPNRRRLWKKAREGLECEQRWPMRAVGENLAVALCPGNTLAGVLLSHLPWVVSSRCSLIVEGGATLRGVPILYRGALLPLSEDGVAIDHMQARRRRRSPFGRIGFRPRVPARKPFSLSFRPAAAARRTTERHWRAGGRTSLALRPSGEAERADQFCLAVRYPGGLIAVAGPLCGERRRHRFAGRQ